mmetsp:Transcript_27468/g.27693  ORF Transcript_27468/g.27693 Transcript_27468/m.27693 type:complete len:197 (+) Transcript_27468:108-698(+)
MLNQIFKSCLLIALLPLKSLGYLSKYHLKAPIFRYLILSEQAGGKHNYSRPNRPTTDGTKKWKSGAVFNKDRKRSRNNGPWWMRDEEKNHPRVLPSYRPWWSDGYVNVDSTWKVDELKKEAKRRGLKTTGLKKSDLTKILQGLSSMYDISDKGFVSPTYTYDTMNNSHPLCYPESYEDPDDITKLQSIAFQQSPPS